MLTMVINLQTLVEVGYTLPPKQALIAVYAQMERKDFSTWDYERRYEGKIKESEFFYHLGDWAVVKSGEALAVLEAEEIE
jgi:hypothetical protein